MSDGGAARDPLTPGQRAVCDLIRAVAPAAVQAGLGAMAARGLLGDKPPRPIGGLDFRLSTVAGQNQWAIDPWPPDRPRYQVAGPRDLPVWRSIEQALRDRGLKVVSVMESRPPRGGPPNGLRTEVLAGQERVRVDLRPIHRELSQPELTSGLLDRGALAVDKVSTVLDVHRSTPGDVVDAATMLRVVGEDEFARFGEAHYASLDLTFDQSEFALALVDRLRGDFVMNRPETEVALRGAVRGNRRQVDADLQALLAYGAKGLGPSSAQAWLEKGEARKTQEAIHRVLGVRPPAPEPSVNRHLEAAIQRGREL